MGNLFTPSGGNGQMPNAISNPDNTRVSYNVKKFLNKLNRPKKPSPQSVNKAPEGFSPTGGMSLDNFFSRIAKKESGNRYNIKGQMMQSGMHKGTRALGKYQFMPATLKDLGYNVSENQFLNNPKMQEEAMRRLTARNAKSLGFNLNNKINSQQAKLLAMAHYSGVGNARKYQRSGGFTQSQLKVQTGTGSAHDSIAGYTKDIAGIPKSGEVSKTQYIFNKLVSTSKGE